MKTVFTNGNPVLGVRGTKITAELMTALNSPSFSTQGIDGHFDIAIEDVNTYGAPNSRAALDAAIVAAGAVEKVLMIRTGEWQLGATALVIPSNIHLAWCPGAYFSGTANVTINGQFFNIPSINPIQTSGTVTFSSSLFLYTAGTLISNSARIISEKLITTSPYTVLPSDHLLFIDNSAAAITINLPSGVAGRELILQICGGTGLEAFLVPHGIQKVFGFNTPFTALDGEGFSLRFNETKGWL